MDDLKLAIIEAFLNVSLGDGISLLQVKAIDSCNDDISDEEFEKIPNDEEICDWQKIPLSQIDDADGLAHLDAAGFRYYIPALMLRLIDNYEANSMMAIGTISCLCPDEYCWEYCTDRYSELSDEQKSTIAMFMKQSHEYIDYSDDDKIRIKYAYDEYWKQFI